ncbi:uncharacterized protein LOC103521360 [Trichonephila clavipes]|nr:uncharacterized protein LOC103521360 [Trichonephila clavipes]
MNTYLELFFDIVATDIETFVVVCNQFEETTVGRLDALAMQGIVTQLPPDEWLPIYAWFLFGFHAGRCCWVFFSFYSHVVSNTTHYDGEIEAIHLALHQLSASLPTPDKAVILSDSSSALQALASNQDKQISRVQDCRELLSRIPTKVLFQWVPSRCDLWGNEMVDLLAKRCIDILQRSTRNLPLHSAKLEINRIYKKKCCRDAAASAAKNKS